MPTPFPGMDPYLEGYLWPDVHTALANKIRQLLAPLIRPRYTARLEVYVVEDATPEAEIGIMYPDVEIMLQAPVSPAQGLHEQAASYQTTEPPPPLLLAVLDAVEVQIATVEIRDTAQNTLVTCIEILSPVNKRDPGLAAYRQKRRRLYQAGVHLLEIDLLRRGTRAFSHPRLPASDYLLTLTRAASGATSAWPVRLRDQLPDLPVPLRPPDPDVTLTLGVALAAIYDEAGYDLSINYQQPPPPPALTTDDSAWIQALVSS